MILSVGEITRLIKEELESSFSDISVEGEISGLKKHVSGHWYFTLKDSGAVISCAMWKGYNSSVFFTPADGMKIVVSGNISVYPPRGNYQLDVRQMKPAGAGGLQVAFEKLKRKLADEGLFSPEHKKPIPRFPKKIGIVTAIDGAAFQDMISIAKRRFPLVELVIAPSKVQGDGAAKSIAGSINLLNQRDDIDLIITGRGGGSLEDLWAFNEEIVARAIFESVIPVISAVGHEIDFTIADFAADLRAATPSAAMELATPDVDDYFTFLDDFKLNSTNNILYIMDEKKEKIGRLLNSYGFRVPRDLMRIRTQQTDNVFYRIEQMINKKLLAQNTRLLYLTKSLESGDCQKILKKGFVLVKQDTDKFVKRAADFRQNSPATLKFYDNEIQVNHKDE
ncbi:MAG: exodeoxyribonuclease VII large subunit [Ignavibacteria bacterium]